MRQRSWTKSSLFLNIQIGPRESMRSAKRKLLWQACVKSNVSFESTLSGDDDDDDDDDDDE